MRVLITGSSGAIASRLIDKIKDKHEIIPYDIKTGQDLNNFQQLSAAIKDSDCVIHTAAAADLNWVRQYPYDAVVMNVSTTHNVAHLCAKYHKRLIYFSTCCVYGDTNEHPETEETLPNPSELYAETKLAGESIVKGYAKNYGMPYSIIRVATVYGEGQREALGVHVFFRQAMENKPITVHGDGQQTRTLTYVDDLVDGVIAVLENEKEAKNQTFNISAEEPISAVKMANDIKRIAGSASPIVFINNRPNNTIREEISSQKAQTRLGWKPKHSWEEGLKKTYRWLKG